MGDSPPIPARKPGSTGEGRDLPHPALWVGQSARTACSSQIPLTKIPSELSSSKFHVCERGTVLPWDHRGPGHTVGAKIHWLCWCCPNTPPGYDPGTSIPHSKAASAPGVQQVFHKCWRTTFWAFPCCFPRTCTLLDPCLSLTASPHPPET